MTNPDSEIRRLIELMPASGRMYCKLVSKPEQASVITTEFPVPWKQARPIVINFDLWREMPRPQRDMVLLRTVSWLMSVKWLKPTPATGLVAAGVVGTIVELAQIDMVGAIAAGALTTLAGLQIWRSNRSTQRELEADEAAIQTAVRRGYTETEAARNLVSAIESLARIEERPNTFTELLRSQNLKAIAGLSPVGVPQSMRSE
ncbi:DUF3318 domain-containing protein [Oscillatoria sp. FACHB-1407]|uniref:DUF3318 domain-containing protein n=1 Tax=Oscillatoria sp. FACHB-1407 TaxID=2692847 RepID=UPI00168801E1|nr:DUF3318 domain-containing protein [Oscillatoria sp. FACHB-1407]MBD2462946.1 DUF3318 domain-containing protein [Oscillatoria sp. FACHB-1407]